MSNTRYAVLAENQEVSRHRSITAAKRAGDAVAPAKKVHICDTEPKPAGADPVVITWDRRRNGEWVEGRKSTFEI